MNFDLSGYSEKDQQELVRFVEQESKKTELNQVVSDFTGIITRFNFQTRASISVF
jgi:hypothetical protein